MYLLWSHLHARPVAQRTGKTWGGGGSWGGRSEEFVVVRNITWASASFESGLSEICVPPCVLLMTIQVQWISESYIPITSNNQWWPEGAWEKLVHLTDCAGLVQVFGLPVAWFAKKPGFRMLQVIGRRATSPVRLEERPGRTLIQSWAIKFWPLLYPFCIDDFTLIPRPGVRGAFWMPPFSWAKRASIQWCRSSALNLR